MRILHVTRCFACVVITAGVFAACAFNSDSDIEKMPLADVYANADSALEAQYDNLVMPERLDLTETDKLYTFCIKQNSFNKDMNSDENKKHTESLVKLIYDYSGKSVESSDIIFDSYEDDIGKVVDLYLCYSDEENMLEYSYSPNGTFSISDVVAMDDVHGGSCIAYHLINEQTDIGSLKGIDGFSVTEALDICKTQVVDKLGEAISEDELNVYSVSMFRTPNGSYAYYIVYRKEYLGLDLSESGEYLFADSGFIKPTYLAVQINSEREIYNVTNRYSNVYDEASIAEIEDGSYISLKAACSLLSDYLAEYNVYEIENIDMVYFLPTRFAAESSELVYTKYIPGYEITLQSKLADEDNSANLAPRITAHVSMTTGDIYVFDTIGENQYFVLE